MRNRQSLTAIVALTALLRTPARVSAFVLPPYRVASSSVAAAATSRFDLQPKGNRNSWPVTVKSTAATAAGSATTATGEAITNADEAKRNVRQALGKHFKKTTKEEDVMTAIEILSGFNPTKDPAKAWHLFSGEWLVIGDEFPGTTTTSEGIECTLGRLAFDIFEPVSLPIRIEEVYNTLGPLDPSTVVSDNGESKDFFNIINHFSSRDGSDLRGKVVIKGSWTTDPKNPNRLLIRFFAGTIEPDDNQDLEAWCKVVGLSDYKESEKKSKLRVFASMRKKAVNLMLKLAFGYKPPANELGSGGELSYEMTRSPQGWLDILYLDEDMRVTRGNRGSVVVAIRV